MKNSSKLISIVFIFFLLNKASAQPVKLGADLLFSDEYISLIQNKSIGLITNHTGLLSNGVHLIDTLLNRDDVVLKALFGPEHGIRGNSPDGASIEDKSILNIPIYSLYGKVRKPTVEMLSGIDVLVFDIQDIGARYYTYISTLYNCMEAASDYGVSIIVLDRPNPINGITVDGPLREDNYKSFVAIAPIPIVHGMTIGELAILFNEEGYLPSSKKADLSIVQMINWKREYYFDDCNIPWTKPSPNMPDLETAILYPGLCLLEGVNISEGRGTFTPFKQIGAPYINSEQLSKRVNDLGYTSVLVSPIQFTPISIDTMSKFPKYEGIECFGIKLTLTDRNNFNALQFGIELIFELKNMYPNDFQFRRDWLDKLYGSEKLKNYLQDDYAPSKIFSDWDEDLKIFKNVRSKYLLY